MGNRGIQFQFHIQLTLMSALWNTNAIVIQLYVLYMYIILKYTYIYIYLYHLQKKKKTELLSTNLRPEQQLLMKIQSILTK